MDCINGILFQSNLEKIKYLLIIILAPHCILNWCLSLDTLSNLNVGDN